MAIGSYTFKTVSSPGGTSLKLTGINNSGVVAGYYAPSIPIPFQTPFTESGGTLSSSTDVSSVDATGGINTAGQVAMTYGSAISGVKGTVSPDGSTQIADPAAFINAYDLNDGGVVVGSFRPLSNAPSSGFVYQNGTMTQFQVPNANTEAHGINNAGVIVGTANNYGFIDVGGQISLMAIPGATITDARSINSADTVAGSYFDGTHWHGWIDDGTLHFIDAPGAADTWITGINDSGTIAGYSDTASGGITQGFIATDPPPTDPVSLGVDADYLAAFGREGDSAGVAFWTKELETTTITLRDFVWALTTSPEGQWLHGGQTNAQYVDSLYVNALGRHADAGGQAVWAGALQSGAGRYDVLAAIAQSPEGQMHFAATHG